MSLKSVSNMEFNGDVNDLPPITSPMPANAIYYADFIRGIYISNVNSVLRKNKDYNNAITAVRGSVAGYINAYGAFAYANANVPRIDYNPLTKAILGLRVENTTTNYAVNPLDQTAVNYTAAGLAVSTPSNGWCILTESSANEGHSLIDSQSTIGSSTTTYSAVSIHAKLGTARYLQIQVAGAGAQAFANFDLQDMAVTKLGLLAANAAISPGFDSSMRCQICILGAGNATGNITYSIINDPLAEPGAAYTGTSRTILVSLAQVEKTTYFASTPFAPNGVGGGVSGAVRAADIIKLPAVAGSTQTAFTVFMKGTMPYVAQCGAGGSNLFSLLGTTAKQYAGFGLGSRDGSYPFQPVVAHNMNSTSAVAAVPFSGRTFSPIGEFSVIVTVNAGVLKIYAGMTDAPETVLTACPAIDAILIGRNSSVSGSTITSVGHWGGCVQKVVFYDSALSDSDMMQQFELLS